MNEEPKESRSKLWIAMGAGSALLFLLSLWGWGLVLLPKFEARPPDEVYMVSLQAFLQAAALGLAVLGTVLYLREK